MRTFRLTIFKGDEVMHQKDCENEEWLEGYVTAYLDFCSNDYDYVITEIVKENEELVYEDDTAKDVAIKIERASYPSGFENLTKENQRLRDSIREKLTTEFNLVEVAEIEHNMNKIVENEIIQEEQCNQ